MLRLRTGRGPGRDEVDTRDTACSVCGEQNAPGSQFCWSCHAYLGWQAAPTEPAGPVAVGTISQDSSQDTSKQAYADPRAPLVPEGELRPPDGAVVEERDPFEAWMDASPAVLPVDGTPTTVRIEVANTSAVVDSYVIETVQAPPWLEVVSSGVELMPGVRGALEATLRIRSSRPVPAQHVEALLRVRNRAPVSGQRDLTLPVTVPAVEAPVQLHAEPAVLRVLGSDRALCVVVVDNSRSNQWAQVHLNAADPERVVRSAWSARQVQVPPGGQERTQVALDAPPPAPGAEVRRTVTITATEGSRTATTSVDLVQTASAPWTDTLAVRLDPSVLRLGSRRRGKLAVVLDNRRGAEAIQVTLSGDDTENALTFGFSPTSVQVPPGGAVSAVVTVTAPRVQPGLERTRPVTVTASDGRSDVHADGSVVQLTSPRRGLLRLLLTLLGALLIVLGAARPLASGSPLSAFDLTVAEVAGRFDQSVDLAGFQDTLSFGLLLVVLAALAVLGLTGRSGRLTRWCAVLCALLVVAVTITGVVLDEATGPGTGGVLVVLGCVAAYVGGLLARR